MNANPFTPFTNATTTITAGAASTPIAVPRNATQVRVCVTGATAVRLEMGGPATAASMKIYPNAIEIFSCPPGGQIEFLNTGADSTVDVTFGQGD